MRRRVLAGLAAGAVIVVGCTTEPVPPVPTTAAEPGRNAQAGEVTIRGCTPERLLIPAASLDSCGVAVTSAVNGRLFLPDPESGRPVLDLAASVETQDSQTFTVRLEKGRLFHDGTEVRSRNFVTAWNWAAYGPNRMPAQTWFAPIEGAAAMTCPRTGPCSKDNRPTSMTGLRVVDDHTFTIKTTKPIVDFQTRLTHPVFSPLPDAFFAEDEGKEHFGRLPVGSGAFRLTGNTASEITLSAFDAYKGKTKAQVATVTLKKYDLPERELDVAKAYNDTVAGNLDVTGVIPTDQLVNDVWKQDLKGRAGLRETQTIEALSFVGSDRRLADPRLRKAISMAVDREALARQVFAGTRVPAASWVSPEVPGYQADACGDLCLYNLAEARRLYREAGGYAGEFRVIVNADGGHKQWADSLCNQLKNALELDCQVSALTNQAEVMRALDEGRLSGLVRQEWAMDYQSPAAYLSGYTSESRTNRVKYANPAFDTKVAAALEATTQATANQAYREAELLLRDNPPAVPLWYAATPYGWSSRVTGVRLTSAGALDLTAIRRS